MTKKDTVAGPISAALAASQKSFDIGGMRDEESRLVELNKVGEGWVMAVARGRGSLPRVGVGSPSARAIWWVRAAKAFISPKEEGGEFTQNF